MKTMQTQLILDALEQALWARGKPKGVIHHSDRGSQYVSIRYSERLSEAGFSASVGSIGDSYDNSNEHESHYIYDLLQSNSSDIKPDVLSTDTHGVNHVNFALLDLCCYSFAPLYAQFSSVINDLFYVT